MKIQYASMVLFVSLCFYDMAYGCMVDSDCDSNCCLNNQCVSTSQCIPCVNNDVCEKTKCCSDKECTAWIKCKWYIIVAPMALIIIIVIVGILLLKCRKNTTTERIYDGDYSNVEYNGTTK